MRVCTVRRRTAHACRVTVPLNLSPTLNSGCFRIYQAFPEIQGAHPEFRVPENQDFQGRQATYTVHASPGTAGMCATFSLFKRDLYSRERLANFSNHHFWRPHSQCATPHPTPSHRPPTQTLPSCGGGSGACALRPRPEPRCAQRSTKNQRNGG